MKKKIEWTLAGMMILMTVPLGCASNENENSRNYSIGISVAGLLIFLTYFWSYFGQMWFGEFIYWFSPFSWCSMLMVDFWHQGIYPPLGYVTAVLLGGSLVMGVISTVIYCKKDVHIAKEEF